MGEVLHPLEENAGVVPASQPRFEVAIHTEGVPVPEQRRSGVTRRDGLLALGIQQQLVAPDEAAVGGRGAWRRGIGQVAPGQAPAPCVVDPPPRRVAVSYT